MRRPMRMRARLVALALTTPALAHAQDAGDDGGQKVEIVGSRIGRIDGETALPVQILRREDIDASGVTTTEELVARLAANVSGTSVAQGVGTDASPGLAAASLRGLGSTATLVLLNGRRLANYAFADLGMAVGLHAIPLAALERVEILKDGASALYGSDAIAGVINFVTRDDFQAGELTLDAGATQGGGAARTREVLAAGHGDPARDGYNLFGVVDHQHAGALAARQRSFSATGYRPRDSIDVTSSSTYPGNIPVAGGFVSPTAPACGASNVDVQGVCKYDPATQLDDLPASVQTTALGRATLRVAPDVDAFAELLFEADRVTFRIAATPVNAGFTQGVVKIDVPTTSPFYPTGLGLTQDLVDVHYRTVSLGPRTSESIAVNERAVAGLKGTLAGWDFDGALSIAESHARWNFIDGYVDADALAAAFASGEVDPFAAPGPVGDALLAATERRGEARGAQGITRMVDLHASRDLLRLPAGPLALAVGGEWRGETLRDVWDALAADVAGGAAGTARQGARRVQALFVELDAPLFKGLDAQLAARRDHYSDFGNTMNPKASLAWRPAQGVLLRASGGTGFRAPTLPELYSARVVAPVETDVPDPVRCPVTHLDSDCRPTFLNGSGGNPALKPIHSTQHGVGVVLEPRHDLTASLDYWTIALRDNIADLSVDQVLADPTAVAGSITRGPPDPAFPGLPGPILRIDTYLQNLSHLVTSGVDLGAAWRSDPAPAGRFSARLDGTFVTRADAITYFGQRHTVLGANANGVVLPRWRHELTLGWERGACTVTLSQSFSSRYTDENPTPDGHARRVGATALWDAQLAYAASKAVTLRLGAHNLFNRNPPFSNEGDSAQTGYDPGAGDPRGRFVYATLTTRFR